LIHLVEGVLLPVVGVVCELDGTLDVCSMRLVRLQFPRQ
jgi:hypothetical protein